MFLWAAAAIMGGLGTAPSGLAAEPSADTPPADVVTSAWQHHKVKFNYVGFTSLYTCDGLEDHVRQILLHIGARKDADVRAVGCPGPNNGPSRTAWVDADFYTLAPAAGASGTDAVQARWTPLEVTARRPNFMGDGDCELIAQMKDLITQNFSLRNIEYRTDCFAHQLVLDGFAVKGQALRALPVNVHAVTG
jgi:hypothetical protein